MALTGGIHTSTVQAGLPSYVVAGELDAGGYGVTFDATLAGQRLAVKVLDVQSHEAAVRTPLEIAALRSVHHPNVVRIVDEGFLDTPAEPNRTDTDTSRVSSWTAPTLRTSRPLAIPFRCPKSYRLVEMSAPA
jgi:hypothetical protein